MKRVFQVLTVHAIMDPQLYSLLMLVVTTTVNPEILEGVVVFSTIQTHCRMDGSVVVWRLPAALTPTYRGSSRHSVRPPLRTLN